MNEWTSWNDDGELSEEFAHEQEINTIGKFDSKEEALEHLKESGIHVLDNTVDDLLNDKQFILEAVEINAWALMSGPYEFKDDKDIMTTAINNDSDIFHHASDRLRNDPEVVYTAISKDIKQLKHASNEIKELVGEDNQVEKLNNYIQSKKMAERFNSILPQIEQSQTPKKKLKL